jgi:3-hydroxymyristoyl/3-hydroxydecanoyl-(acyl carrier protein) dehydratase
MASGSIASVFGPLFLPQEEYRRQVRMPMPPLLLADRVTGLVGKPASHGTGVIWTETDIAPDAWYLHHGRMPAGITVEAGQADLLLCSWLGADLKNKGERVYRLLGCDLIFHDGLPMVGETVEYEIHITGHAELGGIRLFFFHSDCRANGRLIQSVRNGQAGFFTDAELASSEGVLWSPALPENRPAPGRIDAAPVLTRKSAFDAAEVRAFAEGRLLDCFGAGFEIGASHTRSPGIPVGPMQLFDRVVAFDPLGGPWGRGYLRAERSIAPGDWFFAGHFKEDPCMPGTLMCEGGMQAMAFYLAAHGVTLTRDGWRFEPLPGETFKMRCRGQLTPSSHVLVYEVFVRELIAGPQPVLRADLLCTVDGQKAFHAAGAALRLIPGWPDDLLPAPPLRDDGDVDIHSEASARAVALGRPSLAFGKAFERFDHLMRGPRLPAPPYHFITRILSSELGDGAPKAGARVEAAYDIPPDAWYFDVNGRRGMPFAVLLEAALQPCGWLATAVGCPLTVDRELFFRNLDGVATQLHDLTPRSGRLITRATLTSISAFGGMILVNFELTCEAEGRVVLRVKTGFGFFPEEALANQVGLAMAPHEQASLGLPDNLDLDLRQMPAALFGGAARLAAPPLLMLDRITGHWTTGGRAGLGLIRGEKAVDPGEWFFKAHFYQDPVQPGSLGVEALLQLLQALMLRDGMADGIDGPSFEPLALDLEATWRYRGQVVPTNRLITTLVEVLERGRDDRGAFAIAAGTLYVDGRKIYELPRFGMRIVGPAAEPPGGVSVEELTLDPAQDIWLVDHCPTFVVPALPMTVTADLLAGAARRLAPHRLVIALRNLALRGWIAFPAGPRRLRVEAEAAGPGVVSLRLLVWRDAPRAEMSRFDLAATAEAHIGEAWPEPPQPWQAPVRGIVAHATEGENIRDMFAECDTFHGPAFHRIRYLRWSGKEGLTLIDADPGRIPNRLLNPLLLDSVLQAILGDTIARIDPAINPNTVSFPAGIDRLSLYGPAPVTGTVTCVIRYLGLVGDGERFLRFGAQLACDGRVWAEMELREVLFPNESWGRVHPRDRRAFAVQGRMVPGMALSRMTPAGACLDAVTLQRIDWLPGTIAALYAAPAGDLLRSVAVKEHLAASWGVHPASIVLDASNATGSTPFLPFLSRTVRIGGDASSVHVTDAGPDRLDRDALAQYWMPRLGGPRNVMIQLLDELCGRFLHHLRLIDPAAIAALHGRPVLLLANHQVHLESVIFSELAGPLLGLPAVTISRVEHRESWIGGTATLSASYPDAGPHEPIVFFDRTDPGDMLRLLTDYRTRLLPTGKSLMVHVTGEVARSCREPVTRVSSVLLDLAIECGLPVIPVRFVGALPAAPLPTTATFPVGFARQDIILGAPVMPETLRGLPLVQRVRHVVDAINGIMPSAAEEAPLPPQPEFAAQVAGRMATGESELSAVLRLMMREVAAREPALLPFAEGRVPPGWTGPHADWARRFLAWLG